MNAPTPIHSDPLLAEVFELLHPMELCQSREPFQWMASDALRKLSAYEAQSRAKTLDRLMKGN
ncbi:hypothetical protein SAMN05443245_5213 [Paraburkholderia fungorum]|uniref:Uncharacterized protein n=1 Tax=Paraburkholderia fungorum TaxID=134537 RepID=A0A1H1II78_9BURK|nr:hypothetical protein [Paraburkholderia fungorum]SDR37344.1 hypothetical protein SAMN05443245_5213 [Paraburkholderia fungorum]